MALNRGDITVAIPKQYDPAEVGAADLRGTFGDSHDGAVSAVHERARLEEATLANLSRDATEGNVGSGYRAIYTSEREVQRTKREKRHREEMARAAREAMLHNLDGYIDWLDEQIEHAQEMIDEIDAQLDALDQLDALHADGELDPTNPAHRRLMRDAGIDPDDYANDPDGTLRRRRDGLQGDRQIWVAKRDGWHDRRDRAQDWRDRIANAETREELQVVANEAGAAMREDGYDVEVARAIRDMDTEQAGAVVSEGGFNEFEQQEFAERHSGNAFGGGFGEAPADEPTTSTDHAALEGDDWSPGGPPMREHFATAHDGPQSEPAPAPDQHADADTAPALPRPA